MDLRPRPRASLTPGEQFSFSGSVIPLERRMAALWSGKTADYEYGSFVVPRGFGRPVAVTGVVTADQWILGPRYARDTVFFPEPEERLVSGP